MPISCINLNSEAESGKRWNIEKNHKEENPKGQDEFDFSQGDSGYHHKVYQRAVDKRVKEDRRRKIHLLFLDQIWKNLEQRNCTSSFPNVIFTELYLQAVKFF